MVPPSSKQMSIITGLFLCCVSVDFMPPTVVLQFKPIPEKAWPLTPAGIPAFSMMDNT